jgi:hypothetical protein
LLCHATGFNTHYPAADDSFLTMDHSSSDYLLTTALVG